jgi:RNA polymerase primary sigma factor
MSDIETDLPKVKKPVVKSKSKAKPEEKATKSAKTAKTKHEAKSEKTAKPTKKVKADKTPAKSVKAPAKSVKAPAKPSKAAKTGKSSTKPGKATAITVDSVSASIANYMAGAKPSTAKVEYDSAKSVMDGLSYKAASILLRAYSDKNLSSVTHGDSAVAKAAKALLVKNATAIRSEASAKHVKKMAGQIVKAAKSAESGKLTASDYRAVAFEV